MQKPREQKDWEHWIDQQIREAQERGDFDNLPGAGKPLDPVAANPFAQDRELSFKILKDSGYAPEWIELDKAIRSKLERARTALIRNWEWRQSQLTGLAGRSDRRAEAERTQAEARWDSAIADFEKAVETINKDIIELNLKVPGLRFQRVAVNASREVNRLTGIEE